MTQKIPELDGLRALAVLPVIAFHFSYLKWVVGGYLGVDLFFVLSGFLITSLLLAEQRRTGTVSLRNFYARRALRILPPLAACVALALAAVPSTTLQGALAALFFAANMVESRILGGLLHTWSIAVEEHFYFAWPLLFLWLGERRMRFLAWTILIVLAVRIVVLSMKMDVYTPTYTRADSLAIGCYAALLLARGKPSWGRWVAPASLAAVCACFLLVPWMNFAMLSFGFTLFAVLCAVVIVASISTRSVANTILAWQPLQYVGRRSYGLYLYHMPVFLALERFRVEGDPASMAITTVLRVAATFAVAELSYRTIEAWAARYKSRFQPDSRWAAEVMATGATSPRS
jgi:peptidoglycan/LPS O-acetylase OafA/YrhL